MIYPREVQAAARQAIAQGWQPEHIADALALDLETTRAILRGARSVPATIARDNGPRVLALAGRSRYHEAPYRFA